LEAVLVIRELDKLIELQRADSNLRRLKNLIDTADERRAAIEQKFEEHAFSIREVQTRHADLKTKRAALEKNTADHKTMFERAERNLKHAQNQREYEAAMRETEILQKQIGTFENETVDTMEAIETVAKELEERADEINSIDGERAAELAEFEKELASAKAEFKRETATRKATFDLLPANLASVYDRLSQRSRDGIAVAEVVNESCSSCYMRLRPQVHVNVRKGSEIVICESCSRILFIAAGESQAA
jgi:predicted  nucleic acid-binding Zn-ribbon protein